MEELSNAEIDPDTGTNKVWSGDFTNLTNLVDEVTANVLCESEPTASPSTSPTSNPSANPSTQAPTKSPSENPSVSPSVPQPTASPSTVEYCGCPQCTQSVWDTVVCNDDETECFTCGNRITFKQSSAGGSLSLSEACAFVSGETFLNDQCGPMCNPDTCITPEVSVLYTLMSLSSFFIGSLSLSDVILYSTT